MDLLISEKATFLQDHRVEGTLIILLFKKQKGLHILRVYCVFVQQQEHFLN